MMFRLSVAALLATMPVAALADPVYIPLGSADAILVVDSSTDHVTGRIDGVPAVHGLAPTPDGRYLIAGSADERPARAAVPDKPETISDAEHVAHHPGPLAPIARAPATLSTVSIIDTEADAVVRRIDVPGGVHHVAVDPTGRVAAVTHPAPGGITAIDLSSFEIAATVATGPYANYAAFSPDGRRLYVSNAGNGTVSELDVERWIVRRNVIVGASPEHLVLSREGRRLYVNNVEAGTVSVVDTSAFEVVEHLAVSAPLHGIELAENGDTLFVAAMGEDRLVAFDLAARTQRDVALRPAPYHVAAIAGTGKLYVSSDVEPKLWVVDQKTLAVMREIELGGKGHQIALPTQR
ncbi:YncE family protein [Rhodoligotrophos defluvii]|uniref:YncE family protein n=1 Tax=Rhodoligotrophos defluvii TaxID=2561934 RepID=UPI0014859154|nr:cytochrome D1 domain-containing protein [Rhodoligotrophos defluvii]